MEVDVKTRIKKILSSVFIFIGIILIVLATVIFLKYINIEETAEKTSRETLTILYDEMKNIDKDVDENPIDETEQEELNINDNLYMAILTIPSLDLELPIQSSCTYDNLSASPCFYQFDPLSIAGHNYKAHFGYIKKLEIGDVVILTYINGDVEEYEVMYVTKIHETEADELEDSSYDLTLFTCNYSNNTERILVRLKSV